MPKILKILAGIFGVSALWLAVWYGMMAADVARVKASIDYHYQHLRTQNQTTSLKADAVYATGFPFRFEVAVDRPTLSMVQGDETFSASFARVILTPTDSKQGAYRVQLPREMEALYAKEGAAPEHYFVTADVMPKLLLNALDSKKRCGFGTDQVCDIAAPDAPLISFAAGVPKAITLTMTLNGESRTEPFELLPMEINVPIYQPIPEDMTRPLEIFVRVLREALVFKTK